MVMGGSDVNELILPNSHDLLKVFQWIPLLQNKLWTHWNIHFVTNKLLIFSSEHPKIMSNRKGTYLEEVTQIKFSLPEIVTLF